MHSLEGERMREWFGLATFPAVLSRAYLARTLAERGIFDEEETHGKEAMPNRIFGTHRRSESNRSSFMVGFDRLRSPLRSPGNTYDRPRSPRNRPYNRHAIATTACVRSPPIPPSSPTSIAGPLRVALAIKAEHRRVNNSASPGPDLLQVNIAHDFRSDVVDLRCFTPAIEPPEFSATGRQRLPSATLGSLRFLLQADAVRDGRCQHVIEQNGAGEAAH